MAIQEQQTEFNDELDHDEDFVAGNDEKVPDVVSKKAAQAVKGTPSWRRIEDYKDKKRLSDELEDLDDFEDKNVDE